MAIRKFLLLWLGCHICTQIYANELFVVEQNYEKFVNILTTKYLTNLYYYQENKLDELEEDITSYGSSMKKEILRVVQNRLRLKQNIDQYCNIRADAVVDELIKKFHFQCNIVLHQMLDNSLSEQEGIDQTEALAKKYRSDLAIILKDRYGKAYFGRESVECEKKSKEQEIPLFFLTDLSDDFED